jgi:predicted dehydrogenase
MGRWHADAARRAGARVVAVADPELSRAGALAGRHPDAKAFTDLHAAIEATGPRAAHLCTPPASHEALAHVAISCGLHVLIEKPMAEDAAATRRILDQAASRGVLAVPTHQFLFQTGVLDALAALSAIAPLVQVEHRACTAGAVGRDDRGRDDVVAEILPHALALLHRLLPGCLGALTWQVLKPAPGEMLATAAAGGVGCSILVSTAGRPTRNVLRLIGGGGTIHVDLFHGFAVREGGDVSRARKILQPFAESGATLLRAAVNLAGRALRSESAYPGLRELVRRFYAAALGGAPTPISAEETLAVAEARDALLKAADWRGPAT